MNAAGIVPVTPMRKWRAVTVATIVLAPVCWSMLLGAASDVAFGLALVPFVFLALSFLSQHPAAPSATVRAMGLAAVVGLLVAAVTHDGVTAVVAGVGAGGIVALRRDAGQSWRARAIAIALVAVYTIVLAHTAGAVVLLTAPVLPFTAIGIADHLSER
jgi:hypothetical protein